MNPTHKRRARLAECIQFDGVTIPDLPYSMTPRNGSLMLRDDDSHLIGTLHPLNWVVIGEDEKMRIYTDAKFQLMYEVIE